jgi:CheY-like chemotaxis protein
MNSLFIYNENISPDLVKGFELSLGETISFSINNQTLAREDYSFDSYVTEFLKQFSEKKFEVIFIPINLSLDNYLEFSGLKIGYHIRLTQGFVNQETPLVFLAREDSYEINKLTHFGEILSCPHIYLTEKLELEAFKKQIVFIKLNPNDNVIKKFIDRIHIKPAGNYATHHSIANEWSIIRWSKTLESCGVIEEYPDDIESIEKKIESNLYYKFLTSRFPIDKTSRISKSDLNLKYNGRILYIDDESDKGWNELFCSLFWDGEINKVENYESLGPEFNGLEMDSIIALSVEKAKDFDLVILDFRLTHDDFYEKDPKKITGFKILQKIKEFNKGIQVIIFSASNKIWNLQALQEAGSDGFIIKESPENSVDPEFTTQSILNIIKSIENGLKYAFLKNFYDDFYPIKTELIAKKDFKKHPNFLPKEFVNEIIKWIDLANDNLSNNKTEAGLTTTFLLYFTVIENIANRIIDIDNPILIDTIDGNRRFQFEFRKSNQKLRNFREEKNIPDLFFKTKGILTCGRNIPWTQKILNTFDLISGDENNLDSINVLVKKRNNIIHANSTTGNKIKVEIDDIIIIYKYIISGLKNIK